MGNPQKPSVHQSCDERKSRVREPQGPPDAARGDAGARVLRISREERQEEAESRRGEMKRGFPGTGSRRRPVLRSRRPAAPTHVPAVPAVPEQPGLLDLPLGCPGATSELLWAPGAAAQGWPAVEAGGSRSRASGWRPVLAARSPLA